MMGPHTESYLPLGNLEIDFHHGDKGWDGRRELDLETAVASVHYRLGREGTAVDRLLCLPHRQCVWTIPKVFRVFLRHDRQLFAHIGRLLLGNRRSIQLSPWVGHAGCCSTERCRLQLPRVTNVTGYRDRRGRAIWSLISAGPSRYRESRGSDQPRVRGMEKRRPAPRAS